jgi:hypothetical protein
MSSAIAVLDTGVLCCWLEVPGRETAGSEPGLWNNARANEEISRIIALNGTIVLPNSVIVETARHISMAQHSRRTKAMQLLDRALASLDGTSPWQRFEERGRLWDRQWYDEARRIWPDLANRRISLTDYSVLSIVRYFRNLGIACSLLTTEQYLENEAAGIAVAAIERRPRR